jgi:hypothetical protein
MFRARKQADNVRKRAVVRDRYEQKLKLIAFKVHERSCTADTNPDKSHDHSHRVAGGRVSSMMMPSTEHFSTIVQ